MQIYDFLALQPFEKHEHDRCSGKVPWFFWWCFFGGGFEGQNFSFYFFHRIGLRLRLGLIGALAAMESLMLKHGRKLTANAVKEFERAYIVFRFALNELAADALQKGQLRYHVRPKLHQMGHTVYHFLPKNPRYYMCYADEDMVSRAKNVAAVSHPLHCSRLSMLRYIIHVCMKWSGETV